MNSLLIDTVVSFPMCLPAGPSVRQTSNPYDFFRPCHRRSSMRKGLRCLPCSSVSQAANHLSIRDHDYCSRNKRVEQTKVCIIDKHMATGSGAQYQGIMRAPERGEDPARPTYTMGKCPRRGC